MKQSRFTDSQIIAILKQAEAGTAVPEVCREHGISSATFYKWRSKYAGMDASLMARMRELEAENARLKKMYAEERLKAEIIQEAMAKKCESNLADVRWRSILLRITRSVFVLPVLHLKSVKPAIGIRQS
mgnify:CR=1 FL=1